MEIILHDHTEEKQAAFSTQDPLAIVWDNKGNTRQWYIALYIDDSNDGTMRADHSERYTQNCDNEWKRPPNDDNQDIRPEQYVPCVVEGMWDLTCRTAIFKLFNADDIKSKFEE